MAKRELTPKQAEYIKALRKTKNHEKAMLKAGYKPTTARSHNVVKGRRIKEVMKDVLDRQGVTQEAIGQAIKDGLKANKKTDIDHKIRLDSAKLGSQLRGDYSEKHEVEHSFGDLTVEEIDLMRIKAKEIVK